MTRYEEGIKIIEDCCGNGKDNVITLSTIAIELSDDGIPYPYVRDVDAYYENGVFYITTWAKSNKILQINHNNNVAFSVNFEGISGNGIAQNLGWVLDKKNTEIRTKLRKCFSDWYDDANNEQNENCIILSIHIRQCNIFRNHGAVRYNLDFLNKIVIE